MSSIQFDELTRGKTKRVERLDHGIEDFVLDRLGATPTHDKCAQFLRELASGDHRLIQSEFHHARFVPAAEASPARSLVKVVFHIIDHGADRRIILEAEVGVEWSGLRDERGNLVAAKLDATDLDLDGRVDVIVAEDRGNKGQNSTSTAIESRRRTIG